MDASDPKQQIPMINKVFALALEQHTYYSPQPLWQYKDKTHNEKIVAQL